MSPLLSPTNSRSSNKHGHYGGSSSIGVWEEDLAISLLQTQLEMTLIQDEISIYMVQFQESVERQLDALNMVVDDIIGLYKSTCLTRWVIWEIISTLFRHVISISWWRSMMWRSVTGWWVFWLWLLWGLQPISTSTNGRLNDFIHGFVILLM